MKNARHLLLPLLLTGLLASGAATPSTAMARPAEGRAAAAHEAAARPDAGDLTTRLSAIPGMRVVREHPAPAGYRSIELRYRQPVDHRHPGRGTFEQRLFLLHRATDRPMVLYTNGYDLDYQDPALRTEPTEILKSNQISVEHRYFGSSTPHPTDWTKLDIWQAATDHHRIVRALRTIYPAAWISTGGSKSGMATVYHRRFYPHDVAGSVAYSAINITDDRDDSAEDRFLERVGSPECRRALTAVQRELLGARRSQTAGRIARSAAAHGDTLRIVGSADRLLEFTTLMLPERYWMGPGEQGCDRIPRPSASSAALYAWFDGVMGLQGYTDTYLRLVTASFYQLGTQLGMTERAAPQLAGMLRHPGIQRIRTLVPRDIPMRFQPRAMPDIDRWVRHHGSELLFVYGENDPVRSEPFTTGPGSRDAHVYLAPHTGHHVSLGKLSPGDRERATATLRRWAGVDGPTA
ncbi:S28 family serine protease [Streptomyces sp. NPDC048595]|uniref:S28 family serine protease n=1 Tax=Streptomyces sp. NPDC048595 TaxID=3365576 RepID=UPI0037164A8E